MATAAGAGGTMISPAGATWRRRGGVGPSLLGWLRLHHTPHDGLLLAFGTSNLWHYHLKPLAYGQPELLGVLCGV